MQWEPSATLETIHKRARIYQQIRNFFGSRNFLEVDTPILSKATNTDAQIGSIQAFNQMSGIVGISGYLGYQTSKENHAKQLNEFFHDDELLPNYSDY